MAKILEMPKSNQQLWNDANKLRIDEYADAFQSWMEEYRRQQFGAVGDADKPSSGISAIAANSHGATARCESAPIQSPAVSPSAPALSTGEHAPGPADQVSGLSTLGMSGTSILDDSCGHGQAKAGAHLESVQMGRATAGIQGCYGSGESTADDGGDFDA